MRTRPVLKREQEVIDLTKDDRYSTWPMSSAPVSFEHVSQDVVVGVLAPFLGFKDLCALFATCKTLRAMGSPKDSSGGDNNDGLGASSSSSSSSSASAEPPRKRARRAVAAQPVPVLPPVPASASISMFVENPSMLCYVLWRYTSPFRTFNRHAHTLVLDVAPVAGKNLELLLPIDAAKDLEKRYLAGVRDAVKRRLCDLAAFGPGLKRSVVDELAAPHTFKDSLFPWVYQSFVTVGLLFTAYEQSKRLPALAPTIARATSDLLSWISQESNGISNSFLKDVRLDVLTMSKKEPALNKHRWNRAQTDDPVLKALKPYAAQVVEGGREWASQAARYTLRLKALPK